MISNIIPDLHFTGDTQAIQDNIKYLKKINKDAPKNVDAVSILNDRLLIITHMIGFITNLVVLSMVVFR